LFDIKAKSLIATHLAERMSISNVLPTELMEGVMKIMYPDMFQEDFKFKEFNSDEELLKEYQERCILGRRGANSDIHKGISEGKHVIIEGYTVDPALYIKHLNPSIKSDSHSTQLKELENLLKTRGNGVITKDMIQKINTSNHIADKFQINTEYPTSSFKVEKNRFINHIGTGKRNKIEKRN
jgi:hypothetical protein